MHEGLDFQDVDSVDRAKGGRVHDLLDNIGELHGDADEGKAAKAVADGVLVSVSADMFESG